MNKTIKTFLLFTLYFLLQCLCFFQSGSYTDIIPYATAELGQSQSHGSWTNGFFFLGQSLGLLLATQISLQYGRKKTVFFFAFLLAASSLFCALSLNFYLFLVGRTIQGICCGILILGSQSLVFEQSPDPWRLIPLMFGAVASVLPFTIGPMIGGYGKELVGRESMSWKYWFVLSAAFLLILSFLLHLCLEDTEERIEKRPWDWKGLILLSITIGSLQMIFNMGDDYEWFISPIIDFLFFLVVVSFVCFIYVETGTKEPLVRMDLFLRKNFLIGSFSLAFGFLLFYGLWTTLLVRLQNQSLFPPHLAGILFVSMALFSTPIVIWFPRFLGKISLRLSSFVVFFLLGVVYCWMGYFDFYQKRWFWMQPSFSFILQGISLGLFFLSLTNLIISGLSPKNQLRAVELSSSIRILAQGWASPLIGTLIYHRIVYHKMRLDEWLDRGNLFLTDLFLRFKEQGLSKEIAIRLLDQSAIAHAFVLSLNDAFRLCGVGFFILSGIILLAKEKR